MDRWNPPESDWQDFRDSLMKHLPVAGDLLNGIDQFVQDALNKYMPKSMLQHTGFHPFAAGILDCDVFETHRSVFVRCRFPVGISPKDIRFYVNRRKLKIEHAGRSQEILLPSEVNDSRTVARLSDGILEIRMPKSSGSEPFREIFIRDGGR